MTTFREMRRKRQLLSEEESIEILRHATSGTLALMGDEGYPYSLPISFVYHEGHLYFHSAMAGHKVDAIRHYEKASFSVIDRDEIIPEHFTTHFRSVICFGKIHIIDNKEEKMKTLRLLAERYSPNDEAGFQHEVEKGFNHMLMIRLDIEHLTGKEAIELARAKQKENEER